MTGRLNRDQGQLFYSFRLEEVVPGDHLAREIAAVLDLSWVRAELAPYFARSAGLRLTLCSCSPREAIHVQDPSPWPSGQAERCARRIVRPPCRSDRRSQ